MIGRKQKHATNIPNARSTLSTVCLTQDFHFCLRLSAGNVLQSHPGQCQAIVSCVADVWGTNPPKLSRVGRFVGRVEASP
jgi:hypothetical protein